MATSKTLLGTLAILVALAIHPIGVAISQGPTPVVVVAVDGAATANVSDRVSLEVSGLPAFDLSKPIGESLAWADQMRFGISSPDGKARLDSLIGIDFISKQWRLTISFVPKVAGVYVVAITDHNVLIQHRVTVGGEVPQPDPNPQPPVVTVKDPRVTLLLETMTQTPEIAAFKIALRTAHPTVFILDATDNPLFDKTKPLPQLVVQDGDAVLYRESSAFDLAKVNEVIARFIK